MSMRKLLVRLSSIALLLVLMTKASQSGIAGNGVDWPGASRCVKQSQDKYLAADSLM